MSSTMMHSRSETFVDNGERGADALGELARPLHAAHVRRDDQQVGRVREAVADVEREHRRGVEVVHRQVEEALDLARMEVHGQQPVHPRLLNEVGHQLRGDGRARGGLAVLAGVAEIGQHRRHPAGRRAPQRIGHHQKLHQVVVGGVRGGLHHEHVLAADVLVDLDENLLVGEALDPRLRHGDGPAAIDRDSPGDRFGQRPVAVAGEDLDVAVGLHQASRHRAAPSRRAAGDGPVTAQ
jgi:hypothetical protein